MSATTEPQGWAGVIDVDLVRAEIDGDELLVWSTEGGEVVLTRLRPPAPELRITAEQARRLIGALAGLRGVKGEAS